MTSLLKVLKKGISSKHQKLLEKWDENQELLVEGLTFYVKYLGSSLVESSSGEQSTADAIKNIVTMAKSSSRKLEKIVLTVNPKSIKTNYLISQDLLFEVPISRVSYCSADAHYDRVFAFIQSNINDILECRAFLCASKKMAQAITLTISQAFDLAYDLWQSTSDKFIEDNIPRNDADNTCSNTEFKTQKSTNSTLPDEKLLIDFGDDENTEGHSEFLSETQLLYSRKYVWDQSFLQLPSFSKIPFLKTNLCPGTVTDASKLVSEFAVTRHCDYRKHFFLDDNSDFLAT